MRAGQIRRQRYRGVAGYLLVGICRQDDTGACESRHAIVERFPELGNRCRWRKRKGDGLLREAADGVDEDVDVRHDHDRVNVFLKGNRLPGTCIVAVYA